MNKVIANYVVNEIVDVCGKSSVLNENKNIINRPYRNILLFKSYLKYNKRSITKNENYINIIEFYPDDVFKSHFRMEKSTFKVQFLDLPHGKWFKSNETPFRVCKNGFNRTGCMLGLEENELTLN